MGKRWDRSILGLMVPGIAISMEHVRDVTFVIKFGANRSINTADPPASVWENSGLYPYQTSAQSIEILGNVEDDPVGSGAWTVEVQGLDANWEMQTETVTMDGVNPVVISGTWLRIFRATVLTAGTAHANVGDLIMRITGGGATLAIILAALGQTTMALYTVPSGKTAFLPRFNVSVLLIGTGSGGQADVAMFARDNAVVDAAFQIKSELGGRSGEQTREFSVPLKFTEKTDIEARVLAVSNNNTSITAEFDLVVVTNPF